MLASDEARLFAVASLDTPIVRTVCDDPSFFCRLALFDRCDAKNRSQMVSNASIAFNSKPAISMHSIVKWVRQNSVSPVSKQ